MRSFIFFVLLNVITSLTLYAQKAIGGYPISLSQSSVDSWSLHTYNIDAFDKNQLIEQDLLYGINNRCAKSIDVNIDIPKYSSKIKLSNGDLYILKFKVPKAAGVSLLFDTSVLPKGARLFFVSTIDNSFQGAYTYQESRKQLYVDFLKGEEFLIELFVPDNHTKIDLKLSKIYQVYKPQLIGWTNENNRDIGFGTSYPCHINTACPEGDEYRDQIDATVRIEMITEEGVGYCSGSMINNTSNDNTPYVLTAEHCIHGFTPIYDQWRFDYHYESQTCDNPVQNPSFVSAYGSEFVSSNFESDFLLVKLTNGIPSSANTYLSGWNRKENYTPDTTIHIEHPNADIKKLAFEYDPISVYQYTVFWNNGVLTPINSHYSLYFDHGTQQGGASGGPLIDTDGHIIGQLHGGVGKDSTCSIKRKDYFGRLAYSWLPNDSLSRQLKQWLDPNNTNDSIIDGIPYESTLLHLAGTITTYKDRLVPNTEVSLTIGQDIYDVISDQNGQFAIEYINPNNLDPILHFSKQGSPRNGLNVADLVELTKHILFIKPFNNDIKKIVSDANESVNLNISDIVLIRKVILKIFDEFPNNRSWLFFDNDITVGAGDVLTIKAAKIGDVNFSVDPLKE